MPVLTAAVLAMSAAQVLDLVTFVEMMRRVGPEAEVNPLVSLLYSLYGLPMVAIAKVVLLALVTSIVSMLAARPVRAGLIGFVVVTGIAVGLIGGLSNAVAIGAL